MPAACKTNLGSAPKYNNYGDFSLQMSCMYQYSLIPWAMLFLYSALLRYHRMLKVT